MRARHVVIGAVAILGAAALTVWLLSSERQLVRRTPAISPRADQYAAELLAPRSGIPYSVRSPDGRFVGFSVVTAEVYHTISVLDANTGEIRRVASVLEADPYSGLSHSFAMSADGKALLVSGRGSLNGEWPHRLCLAYLVNEDALLQPTRCGGPDDR